ncbi:MAG: thioredoxin family protein [Chlorobium sp.]
MCLCTSGTQKLQAREQAIPSVQSNLTQKPQVTFIELGSLKCVPCRQMQPVLRAIESKYGTQVKVIFYNVWSDKDRHYGNEYAIRIIPTQIFLDNLGKEFFRHEGFFPETEIDKLLQKQGLIPLSNK